MKRVLTIIAVLVLSIGLFAQSPNKMSYQSVIRDASDKLVTNSNVGMQVSILKGSISGEAVYVERHFPATNVNGLVSLEIGDGTVVSGDFTTIDWAIDQYFIKTETDLNGGANYTISGTSQFLSVPYALHANTADIATEYDPYFNASIARTITKIDTANWNNKLDSYTETDSIFGASVAKGITSEDTVKWNAKLDSYTEVDPVFSAAVANGITEDDTTKWNNKLDTYTEADPVFAASLANNITQQDTAKWGDDSDPSNEIQSLSLEGKTLSLSQSGETVVLPDSIVGYSSEPPVGFGGSTTLDLATVSFDLSESRKVLIMADVNIWGPGSTGCEETIRLNIDGNAIANTAVHIDIQVAITGNNGDSAYTSCMVVLEAGSHTVKLRAWGQSCSIYKHPHLNVLVLGN